MDMLFLLLQAVFSAALAWSCFCRIVKMDESTVPEVSLAIWFEGLAAGLVLAGPYMPLLWPQLCRWQPFTTPLGIWLALSLAAALVQIATARHWRYGVPVDFVKESGP